jgi:hypothetical protein
VVEHRLLPWRTVEGWMLGAQLRERGAQLVRPGCIAPVRCGREHRQTAARGEHTGDLRQRGGRVEPVEGVGDHHGVHAGVGERDRLGQSISNALSADVGRQQFAQLALGLDRDHVQLRRQQRLGELARARSEIEHRRAGRQLELAHQRCDRLGRVVRTPALVLPGHGGEVLGKRVKCHIDAA